MFSSDLENLTDFDLSDSASPKPKRQRLKRLADISPAAPASLSFFSSSPREAINDIPLLPALERPRIVEDDIALIQDWYSIVLATLKVHSDLERLPSEDQTLKNLIEQWFYTGICVDYQKAKQACELCEHQGLRWHFEIQNRYNDNTLNIGSRCITKFSDDYGLAVEDNGERFTGSDAKSFISNQVKMVERNAQPGKRFILH